MHGVGPLSGAVHLRWRSEHVPRRLYQYLAGNFHLDPVGCFHHCLDFNEGVVLGVLLIGTPSINVCAPYVVVGTPSVLQYELSLLVENEVHFMTECPLYSTQRQQFTKTCLELKDLQGEQLFIQMFMSSDVDTLYQLGIYICRALNKRKCLLYD